MQQQQQVRSLFSYFFLFYRWGLALKYTGQKLDILIVTSSCLGVFVFHLHFLESYGLFTFWDIAFPFLSIMF